MVLLLTFALLAQVNQRWGTAGALLSAATLVWQPVAAPGLAAIALAVLLGAGGGWRGRLLALARVAVGGMVPATLTLAAYGIAGRIPLLIDDFFLINLRYTDQASVLDHPMDLWHDVHRGYGWTVWVLGAGLVVTLAQAGLAAAQRTPLESPAAALVGLGATVVVSVMWALAAFNGWPDAFVVLPAAAVGIGGLVAALERHLPSRAVVVGAVAWALIAAATSAGYARSSRTDLVAVQRAEARAMVRALPAGSRLLAVGSPQPLVLANQRNPSRLQLFGNGLVHYVDATWPGGRRGYARWIDRRHIAVVILGSPRYPWLRAVLTRSYVRVGGPDAMFRWYLRRDLAESIDARRVDSLLGQARLEASAADR